MSAIKWSGSKRSLRFASLKFLLHSRIQWLCSSLSSPSLSLPLPPSLLFPLSYFHTQCCYPLIDHILQGSEDGLMSLLTQYPDIFAVDNKAIIEVFIKSKSYYCTIKNYMYVLEQKTLEGFVEVAQSSYGCVMVHRRLYVATETWLVHTHMHTHSMNKQM